MRYLSHIRRILDQIEHESVPALQEAAELMAEALRSKHLIYAFGCSHANLVACEMVYRTGALVPINLIDAPGLALDLRPLSLGSQMERYPQYGRDLIAATNLGTDDLLILHSVSGRNTVTIDMAVEARQRGAKVIVITSLEYSQSVPSRHASGKRLFELGDVVLDNYGESGDACLDYESLPSKAAPTSTVIGATLVNMLLELTCDILESEGIEIPVFQSANMPGGDDYNARIMAKHRDQIRYL